MNGVFSSHKYNTPMNLKEPKRLVTHSFHFGEKYSKYLRKINIELPQDDLNLPQVLLNLLDFISFTHKFYDSSNDGS